MRDKSKKAKDVLIANRKVPFVDRILNASKYPVRKNDDGSVSTHLMASASVDGRPFVYPTLQWKGGEWEEDKNASDALLRDNVIWFDNERDADVFARGSWKPYVKE